MIFLSDMASFDVTANTTNFRVSNTIRILRIKIKAAFLAACRVKGALTGAGVGWKSAVRHQQRSKGESRMQQKMKENQRERRERRGIREQAGMPGEMRWKCEEASSGRASEEKNGMEWKIRSRNERAAAGPSV